MHARRLLLDLFDTALRAVDGRARVAGALRTLQAPRVDVFAIGKAAAAMALGAHDALGERARRSLVITKDGHVDPALARLPAVRAVESAHPVPDERSLAAGALLEQSILALEPEVFPVFLVSGGSSSLVESLCDGVTLERLRELNTRGLAAGWDVGRLNHERAALSRLKGGGVARLLAGRAARALFISDVPGDDPDVIGSGLLGRDSRRDSGRADEIAREIVANNESAVRAAADGAMVRGLAVDCRLDRFDGDAASVARDFVAALRDSRADVLVWGGESTVTLDGCAGRGGRNQHLALHAARCLREDEEITLLAAGTDGTDGPTDDAGAIVDARTVMRAELAGVDVERALCTFDSALALEAAEDLLHTGPTGTNVGDLLIGLRRNATRVRDLPARRML